MSIQGKKELAVAALQNGIVIDHIPCDSLFKVVNILGIENMENGVFIGNNLSSRSMGHKGLIKIADIDLPKETLNRIAVVAPNAVINIILTGNGSPESIQYADVNEDGEVNIADVNMLIAMILN